MRNDPLVLIWLVRCPSPEASRRLKEWLSSATAPDTTFVDEVRSFPDDREECSPQSHRLGDYFASIRVLPGPKENDASFRLEFQRRPDAGRPWKDLMVRILEGLRGLAPDTTTVLEYRGDQARDTAPAGG
jgi:hypothetical protein